MTAGELSMPFLLCYNYIKSATKEITMTELSIREMRNALAHLDELLAKSGEIIITRHGKAIARILPMREKIQRPTNDELRKKMGKFTPTAAELIREDRDAR
jgi:antitoxin (DNA-binding transcriptional repressor) of toxin-antitoxin stability system